MAMAFSEQELVWTITGIGVVRPHFDRIMIASNATKAELLASLPMQELKATSYSFTVKEKRHWKHNTNPASSWFALTMIYP